MTLSRFGLVRIAVGAGWLDSCLSVLAQFPPELRAELIAQTFGRTPYWATAYAELSVLNESRAQVAAAGSLGDLPLVGLPGAPDVSRLPASFPIAEIQATFGELQNEMVGVSTNSTHLICDTRDHYIPLTNPGKVEEAIWLESATVQS